MVLGRIPVYSAICISFRPDCSDIRRAISFSALEMLSESVNLMLTKFYHRFKFRLSLCVYLSCLGLSL